MLKEAKRKARLAQKKAKRKTISDGDKKTVQMHDITKTITLEDLTNPNKK